MKNEIKRQEVYARFKADLQPDKKGSGYVCPICGSGSGQNGTGITENKRSPGHYTCWAGCFKNADAFEIIALQAGIEPNSAEAMRAAYERYGISEDSVPTAKPIEVQVDAHAQEAPVDFTDYFSKVAANITSAAAQQYLAKRGISAATAQKLCWGYDNAWRSPAALRAGKNPPASARLIIPTSTHSYLARATTDTTEKAYQKMKEGAVVLYNLQALYSGRAVFVCEGEIDAAAIIEAGGEAVALGSTSNVDKLINACKEKKPCGALLICPDNDEPGRRAADQLTEGLQEIGVACSVVDITGGFKDADEALVADRDHFIKAVQQAENDTKPGAKAVASFLQAVQGRSFEPMPTGLTVLDNIIGGGFMRQTLVMLGAAPGLGKTYFAQQLFEGLALQGHNVLYFNLEMSTAQMLARSFSRIARQREGANITALDVLQGYRWTDSQKAAVERTARYYIDNIAEHIAYNPGGATAQLDEILKQMHAAAQRATSAGKEAPLCVIDYLHLLRGNAKEDAQTVIKRAVDAFKGYAMRYNTVVFVILAFNRTSNKGGQVTQESGRDSSGLEYAADLMLGLNYARIEDSEADSALIDKLREEERGKDQIPYRLKVLKNRLQGGCGKANLTFEGRYGVFSTTDTAQPDRSLPFYQTDTKRRL